jgi:hypothetical protein
MVHATVMSVDNAFALFDGEGMNILFGPLTVAKQ